MGMKIIQAVESVAGFGAHNYFVLINEAGQSIAQINGFQMKDGQISTSGSGGTLFVTTEYGFNFTANTPQQVVAEGTPVAIYAMWEAAKDCGELINEKAYTYNLLDSNGGHNSNAAASTLAACMAVQEVDLPGLTPGMGDIILDNDVIRGIQNDRGVDPDYQYYPARAAADLMPVSLIGIAPVLA